MGNTLVNTATHDQGTLLTTDEVARMCRVGRTTLYKWAQRGQGPAALRVGRRSLYRLSDVERWLDGRYAKGDPHTCHQK